MTDCCLGPDPERKKRRYTLDQIEREEFKETETEISEPEVGSGISLDSNINNFA